MKIPVLMTLIGLCAPVFLTESLSFYLLFTLSIASILECLFFRRFFLFILLVACYISSWRLDHVLSRQLPSDLEDTTLILEGHIDGLIDMTQERRQFDLIVSQAQTHEGHKITSLHQQRLRISWIKRGRHQVVAAFPDLVTEQRWRLHVRAKRPRGLVNPRSFDYQAWMLAKGYVARAYVVDDQMHFLGVRKNVLPDLAVQRSQLAIALNGYSDHLQNVALIKALLLGDKSQVSQVQWDLFQRTGTMHLMAISGLHVGMIALVVVMFFRYFFKSLSLVLPAIVVSVMPMIMGTIAAWYYAVLAGMSVPTQRALWVTVLVSVTVLLGRKASAMHGLGVIACAILLQNPMHVTQVGFVLSFAAVFVLLFSFSHRQTTSSTRYGLIKAYHFVKAQWVMLVGFMVLLPLFGLPLSWVSPLANSVAVPLISLCILPLLFLLAAMFSVGIAADNTVLLLLLQLVDAVLSFVVGFLNIFAGIDPVYLFNVDHPVSMITASIATLCLLLPRYWGAMTLGSVLLCVALLANRQPRQDFSLRVLDVGQGLAMVMQQQSHSMVYDLGASYSDDFSIAMRILTPYLHRQGVNDLDLLVVSHADNDHAGDFQRFHETFSSEFLSLGEPQKLGLDSRYQCHHRSSLPDIFATSIEVLWPRKGQLLASKGNNRSCVVLIRYAGKSILFTGDIDQTVEYALLNNALLPKNIDVLIAPHHGSHSSSSIRFIQHLSPTHVIFSAGYKNSYDHPAKVIVSRYQRYGIQAWHTAQHGAMNIVIHKGELVITAERCQQNRRWYINEGFCGDS